MSIDKNGVYSKLYAAYNKRIFAFLFRMCNDYHLAEELTQETFFQAFRSFGSFKGKSDIFTWLAAIAKHVYYKHLRKNRLTLENLDFEKLAETYIENEFSENPETSYIKVELKNAARRIVKKLPEKYRDVVLLRIYAELSFKQIAEVLCVSESSAKVMYFRAKAMLKEEFENEHLV